MFKVVAISLVVAAGLAACTTSSRGTNGGSAGAGIGDVLGSQFGKGTSEVAATIGGSLIAGLAGTASGEYFGDHDQQMHLQAAQQAFANPMGQQVTWANQQTGNSGWVQANPPLLVTNEVCSRYRQAMNTAAGQVSAQEGCLCFGADGTYQDKQCPAGS